MNLIDPMLLASDIQISIRDDSIQELRQLNDSGPLPEDESEMAGPLDFSKKDELNESSEYCTDIIAE